MASIPSRILTRPIPGYYRLALVQKAWRVPVLLMRGGMADHFYTVVVDGEAPSRGWSESDLETDAAEAITEGELFKHPLLRIVLFGEISDEPTYRYLLAMKDWARLHKPDHPCLHPLRPMDPATLPTDDF